MLFTEESVRANIRNREGKRVFYLGKGDTLTSGARDYLSRERIEILTASQARPERFRLLTGGFCEEKPEHMTHLNTEVLVSKTHPRIVFRGKLDSFQAELLLCLAECPQWKPELEEILSFSRQLIRCDVLEEPFQQDTLCGLTEQEQRRHSHHPQDYYGQPHFMPEPEDGPVIARLNKLRCQAREAELAAVRAFQNQDGLPTRIDLIQALNRLSSMVYILMIRQKSGR